MLTDAELKWLEERQNICLRCRDRKYCRTGKKHGYNTRNCRFWKITVLGPFSLSYPINNYEDAAKFEARVGAYIAFWSQHMQCPTRTSCRAQRISECVACWLKHARIAVEAEMEAENDR